MNSVLPGPRTTGSLLVVAAALEVVEAVASPLVGGAESHDIVAIAAHQQRFAISATLGLVATLLFVPAFLGLINTCVAQRPRLAVVSAWLTAATMAGYVAVRASQGLQLAAVRQGLSPSRTASLVAATFATPMMLVLAVLFLAVGAAAFLLTAVTLWLSGRSRIGVGFLVAFQVLEYAGFSGGHVATIVSHVPLLLAAIVFARTLWPTGVTLGATSCEPSVVPEPSSAWPSPPSR